MFEYIILFLLLVFGFFLYLDKKINRQKKVFFYFCVVVYIIFLGALRGDSIGNDTLKYKLMFYEICTDSSAYYSGRFEEGFIILNKLVGMFSSNQQSIIIVTTLLIWSFIGLFLYKNSINPLASIYILICLGFFAFFFSGIRASIAIAICLLSYEYIKAHKLIKFTIMVFLATLFHKTAVIFLPAYYIYNVRLNIRLILLALVFDCIICLWFKEFLASVLLVIPSYSYYLDSVYSTGSIRMASIINMLIFLVLFLVIYYHSKHYENVDCCYIDNERLNNLVFMGINILFISIMFNVLDRLAMYYTIFLSILLPNVLLHKLNKRKLYIFGYIIFVLSIYQLSIQIFKPEWNNILPYGYYWE